MRKLKKLLSSAIGLFFLSAIICGLLDITLKQLVVGCGAAIAGLFVILLAWQFVKEGIRKRGRNAERTKASAAATSASLTPSAPPSAAGRSDFTKLSLTAGLKLKDYVAFDVETTGFSSEFDRIIEVGALKVLNGQPVDSFTSFVNPDMHIPANVSRLTGITDADVANAPQFAQLAPELMAFIGELPVVAHNASFDARFLKAELNFAGLSYVFKVVDTLPMARKAFPQLENHKLKTLIDSLGLADHQQQHRALDDARIGHELFKRCKEGLNN